MTITITVIFLLFTTLTTTSQSKPPKFPCQPPHNTYPFCNTSLPFQLRAHSILSHLTLPDKIKRLSNTDPGIPHLSIPPYEWWSESLHGIAVNGPGVTFNGGPIPAATGFPQVILTTSSFNRTLWRLIAYSIAVEARAMYNSGQAGLTFWAPNINVFRDPRWGRGQETPGEDPAVAAAYADEYVTGFQRGSLNNIVGGESEDNKRVLSDVSGGDEEEEELMVSACCKHLIGYDLEKWGVYARYNFNAIVTKQDMQDTYEPPFKSCIQEGKASCVMCAYNAVNGIPTCADPSLLQKARSQWGFNGYIASDCDAVATIFEYQHYSNSPEDAVAIALKAGTDINCGTYMVRHMEDAVEKGKVEEEDINKALLNLFTVQLRLGLFDGNPLDGKYGKLGPADVCTSGHKELAMEAVRQGTVLLKNDHRFLPLQKKVVKSLAVIGPMANATDDLGGGYTGVPCSPTSIFEGLKRYVKKTTYSTGCQDVACTSKTGFSEAISISKEADFVIVVAGLDLTQETEDRDRYSLLLPGNQTALVTTIATTSKKPIVLVLTGGGPLDVSFAQDDPRVASIIWVGYPGEAGGRALAEIIFGDHNPGGKLPVTWYPESFTKVPMNNMNMRPDRAHDYPGRTHRFYTGDVVYAFGHGLSYSDYTYNILSAPNNLKVFKNIIQRKQGFYNYLYVDELEEQCESLRFQVEISVTNHGPFDGGAVVMVFAKAPGSFKGTPLKQLVEFERVHTVSYKDTKTTIIVDSCKHLSIVNELGRSILPLGDHTLLLDDIEHIVSIIM